MIVSFLGLLTMQVGILVCSASLITNAVCSILANVLSYNKNTTIPWLIVMILCVFIIVTWSIAFSGSYNESFQLLRTAQVMWSLFICVWIVLLVSSAFSTIFNYICLETRCPESMWLMQNHMSNETEEYVELKANIRPILDNTKEFKLFETNYYRQITYMPIIAAIFYIIIFVYTWIFIQNYKKCIQLKTINPSDALQISNQM